MCVGRFLAGSFFLPTGSNTVGDGKGVRKNFLFSHTCAPVPVTLCTVPLTGKGAQECQTSVDSSRERGQYKFFNIK